MEEYAIPEVNTGYAKAALFKKSFLFMSYCKWDYLEK
jgi:hypothetical protein